MSRSMKFWTLIPSIQFVFPSDKDSGLFKRLNILARLVKILKNFKFKIPKLDKISKWDLVYLWDRVSLTQKWAKISWGDTSSYRSWVGEENRKSSLTPLILDRQLPNTPSHYFLEHSDYMHPFFTHWDQNCRNEIRGTLAPKCQQIYLSPLSFSETTFDYFIRFLLLPNNKKHAFPRLFGVTEHHTHEKTKNRLEKGGYPNCSENSAIYKP